MVPPWVSITIILVYTGIVTLISLTGVFGETKERRQAAEAVLRLLLPWTVVTVAAEVVMLFWRGA